MTTPTPNRPALGAGKPLGAGRPLGAPAPLPPMGDAPSLGGGLAQFEESDTFKPVAKKAPVARDEGKVATFKQAYGHPSGKGDSAPGENPKFTGVLNLDLPPLDETTPHQMYTLAGVTFSKYPFETLTEGQQVWLVPDPCGAGVGEPGRHKDENAWSVQDAPQGGRHIGYIPNPKQQGSATVISNIMKEFPMTRLVGRIEAIKGGYDGLSFGVDVIVQFFEE